MTTQQTINIPELRRLLAEATPGPWNDTGIKRDDGLLGWVITGDDGNDVCQTIETYKTTNASLIAAAVNALPALLDERERLREALRSCLCHIEIGEGHKAGDFECVLVARAALAEMETTRGLDTPAETV